MANLRKHGLLLAVASIAAQGIREGVGNDHRLEAYVIDALQGLTLLEIRDMLLIAADAQNKAKAAPEADRSRVFTENLRRMDANV